MSTCTGMDSRQQRRWSFETEHSDGTVEQHELLPTQVFQDGNN
jgi:hypothetical protein